MSKEIEFKYFINGVETKKEAIDWNRSMSIKPPSKDGNEVHITYMDYNSSICGMSTRHKACNSEYPKPLKGIAAYASQEERDIERFIKLIPSYFKTSTIDESAGLCTSKNSLTYSPQTIGIGTPSTPKEVHIYSGEGKVGMGDINPKEKLHVSSGVKHNKFKAPLDIVQTRQFPKALQLLALATAFGNKKYEATDKDFLNFKRVQGGSQTYFDAGARHNADRYNTDGETKLPHLVHAVWDMMAALEIWSEENNINIEEFSKNYLEDLHKSK